MVVLDPTSIVSVPSR